MKTIDLDLDDFDRLLSDRITIQVAKALSYIWLAPVKRAQKIRKETGLDRQEVNRRLKKLTDAGLVAFDPTKWPRGYYKTPLFGLVVEHLNLKEVECQSK